MAYLQLVAVAVEEGLLCQLNMVMAEPCPKVGEAEHLLVVVLAGMAWPAAWHQVVAVAVEEGHLLVVVLAGMAWPAAWHHMVAVAVEEGHLPVVVVVVEEETCLELGH